MNQTNNSMENQSNNTDTTKHETEKDSVLSSTSKGEDVKTKASNQKSFFLGLGTQGQFGLWLVVIVLVMVLSQMFFIRFDLTFSKAYSLSKTSKKLVSDLVLPLQIKVFFSKSLPPPHNDTEKHLTDLLNEYKLAGNRYFSYTLYDCSIDKEATSERVKENIKEAQSYNIRPLQIQYVKQDKVEFKRAYMGIAIQHGDLIERIPDLLDTYALEYRLTQLIYKMNSKVNYLQQLQEDIEVTLFLSSALEQIAPHINIKGLKQVPNRVEGIIRECNKKNYQKIKYAYINTTMDPNAEKGVEAYGLKPLTWGANPKIKIEAGRGYAVLVLRYKDKVEVINLIKSVNTIFGMMYNLENLDNLENKVNQLIDTMLDINEKIAYLSDKGTMDLTMGPPQNNPFGMRDESGDGAHFNRLVSKRYSIDELKIDEISKDYRSLIIAGPKKNFFELGFISD